MCVYKSADPFITYNLTISLFSIGLAVLPKIEINRSLLLKTHAPTLPDLRSPQIYFSSQFCYIFSISNGFHSTIIFLF